MTLVMVTHDVSLKFFADRIIWLRDGKIQRVETVGARKQQEAYDGLYADLVVRWCFDAIGSCQTFLVGLRN